MDCEPPFATGQPFACADTTNDIPTELEKAVVKGYNAWAATPIHNARAFSDLNVLASAAAGSAALIPNLLSKIG